MYQLRGVPEVYSEWFHAEKIGSEILLTAKGKKDQEKAILIAEQAANEPGTSEDTGGGGGC